LNNFQNPSFSFHFTFIIGFIILCPSDLLQRHDADII